MSALVRNIEDAARMAMGPTDHHDPLPPGPNYGPFGYFRLATFIFAGMVALLAIASLF